MERAIPPDVAALVWDFEALVRLYRPKVFRFALASLRDLDAAETITQDCFLRAHQARERFRQDCSMHTWLMQIAVNLIRDHIRNRRFQFWRRASLTAQPIDLAGHMIADSGPVARSAGRCWRPTGGRSAGAGANRSDRAGPRRAGEGQCPHAARFSWSPDAGAVEEASSGRASAPGRTSLVRRKISHSERGPILLCFSRLTFGNGRAVQPGEDGL